MAVRTEQALSIKGYIPLSMLDWEGRLVTTIFLGGCNFECPFCHNAELVTSAGSLPDIPWEIIEEVLAEKTGWIDGVCISGGEPTINKSLPQLMRLIKQRALFIKLDTNGARPDVLRNLIGEGLVDAVAMDIKTTFSKYSLVTKNTDVADKVRESIDLLVDAENRGVLTVEFRTTVVPTIVERGDVMEIAEYLRGTNARRYTLQQFNPETVMTAEAGAIQPLRGDAILELAAEVSGMLPTVAKT